MLQATRNELLAHYCKKLAKKEKVLDLFHAVVTVKQQGDPSYEIPDDLDVRRQVIEAEIALLLEFIHDLEWGNR